MNARTAEILLRCYLPGKRSDAKTQKAVKFAEGDADMARQLNEQIALDEQMVEVIHCIQPPDDLRQKLGGSGGKPNAEKVQLRSHIINPAVLTAILGVLLLGGVLVFFIMERMEKFPGREGVEGLLGTAAKMSGHELEAVESDTSQLGDWLYMRGYEGYEVPPDIAKMPVIGSRVFRYDGRTVAQVAVGTPEELRCLIYQFHASEFSVQLPQNGDWQVMTRDPWAGAIRQRGDHCILIARRGSKADMHEFLKKLPKK